MPSKKVYNGLISIPSSLKKNIVLAEEEDTDGHCQSGIFAIINQRMFEWLDETLNNKP